MPGRPAGTEDQGRLIRFGAGLTGFTFANFFVRNSDNVLIGRFLGEQALGFYDRAYKLLLMPLQLVTNPLARSMVPTLSRLVDQPARYRGAFLDVVSVILAVTLPAIGAVIVVADGLVPFMLGEQWRESARIFQVLGFAGLLQPLNNPAGWLFISQGRSTHFMYWGIVSAVIVVTAISFGLQYGVYGVAVAYAASEYLRTPLLWALVGRRGPVGLRCVAGTAGPYMLAVHLAIGALWVAGVDEIADPLLAIAVALVASYAIVGAVVLAFPVGRRTLRSVRALRAGRGAQPA
jgi:PST family polysaccharide transporter